MNKHFPPLFLKRIQEENPDLYNFFNGYVEREPYKGLRINPQKSLPSTFLTSLHQVPWCPLGFYTEEKLGAHPFHQAGMFYIQEPSAMAVVELMNIQPDDIVLDCSAAPGGKSTHIAGYLNDDGFLWSHDVDRHRAQQLVFNLERMGFHRGIVSTGSLDQLQTQKERFTKILVDAPCSGEGMFIKDEGAIQQWSQGLVEHCAHLQEDILDKVVHLLKPGGELIYSTCTFSKQENELQIIRFLDRHPEFELVKDEFLSNFNQQVTNNVGAKILPHQFQGEGHYLVKLRKKGTLHRESVDVKLNEPPREWMQFQKKFKIILPSNLSFQRVGNHLYATYHSLKLNGITPLRDGLCLGEIKSFGFVPDHALSHANGIQLPQIDLALSSPLLSAYLRGESFSIDKPDGWWVVSVHHQGLGWVKVVNGVAKNHFPKGLRLHYVYEA